MLDGGVSIIPHNRWLDGLVSRWHKPAGQVSRLDLGENQKPVTWLWTCGGTFFGYRLGDELFTYKGKQAGHFSEGDEIYNAAGNYIGELRLSNRLVTNESKETWHRKPFPSRVGATFRRTSDLESIQVMPGFRDFAPLDSEASVPSRA
jgi:hypothetical protein